MAPYVDLLRRVFPERHQGDAYRYRPSDSSAPAPEFEVLPPIDVAAGTRAPGSLTADQVAELWGRHQGLEAGGPGWLYLRSRGINPALPGAPWLADGRRAVWLAADDLRRPLEDGTRPPCPPAGIAGALALPLHPARPGPGVRGEIERPVAQGPDNRRRPACPLMAADGGPETRRRAIPRGRGRRRPRLAPGCRRGGEYSAGGRGPGRRRPHMIKSPEGCGQPDGFYCFFNAFSKHFWRAKI